MRRFHDDLHNKRRVFFINIFTDIFVTFSCKNKIYKIIWFPREGGGNRVGG